MKPSDLLLVALAGCLAVDIIDILQKKRQDVRGLEINVQGEQDDDPPWTFRKAGIEVVITGQDIKRKAVEDAIRLSEEKYCSVSATIRETTEIELDFRIEEV
jgi:putative redox protein